MAIGMEGGGEGRLVPSLPFLGRRSTLGMDGVLPRDRLGRMARETIGRSDPQTPLGTICTTEIEEGRDVYISPYHHIPVPSLLYKCTHMWEPPSNMSAAVKSGQAMQILILTDLQYYAEKGKGEEVHSHSTRMYCSSPFLARSMMSHPRRSFIHLFCHKRGGMVSMLFAYIIYQKSTSRPPLFRIAKITGFTHHTP